MNGIARTKRVPKWIFTLPASQKLSFIKGYFDADGYLRRKVRKNNETYGQIVFSCANKHLLEDIKLLMISCGLNPLKIFTYKNTRKLPLGKEIKEYETSFLTANISDSYKPLCDLEPVKPQIEFARIKSIEGQERQKVYDIEVEGTHNFIANGIIVHNSKLTMKYPSCYLVGRGAKGETLSLAIAGKGQTQDTGAKMIHIAPETTSNILSKSISFAGGTTAFRGVVQVNSLAKGSKTKTKCDAMILDNDSGSDTYPNLQVDTKEVMASHEATVSKIEEEQIFYLMSRGLSRGEAESLIVNGFADSIIKELPIEYGMEIKRVLETEFESKQG